MISKIEKVNKYGLGIELSLLINRIPLVIIYCKVVRADDQVGQIVGKVSRQAFVS